MDTVDYIGARVWLMKGIHHLLNWTLIMRLLMLTSNTDASNQTEPVICCQGDTASFHWTYEIPPFYLISWHFENTQLAETSESSFTQDILHINPNYKDRFFLHKPGYAGFNLRKVVKTDEGNYRCIIILKSIVEKELNTPLEVKGITLGDYTITVTNTTEDCRTLKCGEPVGTNTTYEWSIRVNGTDETHIRTTTNTFKFCRNPFYCSVKCQRDHDCTETTWMCFKPGQSGRQGRNRRTFDEPLVPCDEDTDSGNQDDSSPNTTGIAVAVVIAVIAVIAILTVVTLRKLKSRAGRRSDSFKDKETCERMNLNPIT